MDREIAAAIIILIVFVIAFVVVRLFMADEFTACMDSCRASSQLEHLKCAEYCSELAQKGILVVELPK